MNHSLASGGLQLPETRRQYGCCVHMSTDPPSDLDGGRSPERRLIDAAFEQELSSPAEPSPVSGDASSPCAFADRISGYEIAGEIHRGGQGVVYLAVQEGTKRKVAIKVMREGPFAGPRDKARFDREVEVLGQLNHPNIVAIHNSGSVGGMFYFVMDYISGQPLDVWMASGKRSIEETLKLFAKICEAVNAAHLKGVIHRDLKPGNIRIDSQGEPHVLDFGLAKMAAGTEASVMTVTGQFIGSLPWSSPEQAEGIPGRIDTRTDVYSLGVIVYQMLTGRFPYEVVGNIRDVLDRIIKTEPAKPSTIRRQINDEVETIVLKCLSKERERRYQSAGELARDIGHYLAGDPIEAKRDSALYVLKKSLRRYRVPVTIAGSFFVLTTLSLAVSTTLWQKAARERGQADRQRQAAEFQAYIANIAAADAALRADDVGTAKTRLNQCPQSLRQWEWFHLAAMCDQSITTIRGIRAIHRNAWVPCVHFSPDGKWIITRSEDSSARLWDAATGVLLVRFCGHTREVLCASFSPDGKRIVTGSQDKTAKLWDAATGAELATLRGHTDAVWTVVFDQDGRLIATGSDDRTARLWDAATGAEVAMLSGHSDAVDHVAFGLNGKRVLTHCFDETMSRLWDTATGTEVTTFHDHPGTTSFNPDGTLVFTYSGDSGVSLCSAETGAEVLALRGSTGQASRARFSPDGKQVATWSGEDAVKLWDTATGGELTTLRGHSGRVWYVAFSPDGRKVITTSGEDYTTRVYDVATGAQLVMLNGHTDRVQVVEFSPDSGKILTACEDGTARLWDPATGAELTTYLGHPGAIMFGKFSPDGKRIVTLASDVTARLWDTTPWPGAATLRGHVKGISHVVFTPHGERIITASDDGVVRLWDMATRAELASLRGHADAVGAIDVSFDGRRIVTGSMDKTAKVWDMATGAELTTLRGHTGGIDSVAFSPDGTRIVTRAYDYTARLWDAATGAAVANLGDYAWNTDCFAFSPHGQRIVTLCDDSTARLWDTPTGNQVTTLRGHTSYLRCVAYSPDGKLIVTGSDDKTARLWDAVSGTEVAVLRGHTDTVGGAEFSPDGAQIVTWSDDGTARIWHAATWAEVAKLDCHAIEILQVTHSPNGRRIVITGNSNTATMWDTTMGKEVAMLRSHTGYAREITFSPDGSLITASDGTSVRLWDSVPYAQRYAERQAALAAMEKAKPIVAALRDRLGDWAKVATAIEEDTSMDDVLRHQALNLVLKSSSAEINARLATQPSTQPAADSPASRPATQPAPTLRSASVSAQEGEASALQDSTIAQLASSAFEASSSSHTTCSRAGRSHV